MKGLLIFALCVALVHCDRLRRRRVNKPVAEVMQRVSRASTVADYKKVQKPELILNQETDVNSDGSWTNAWESENGIKVVEEGSVRTYPTNETTSSVSGRIEYKDDDGMPVSLTYTADANGYRPVGNHLPTPPPVPAAILRALQYIKDHPYTEPKRVKRCVSKLTGNNRLS